MGVLKPLLPVGGEPAILRCVNTARTAGVNQIIVVTGHNEADIKNVLSGNMQEVILVHNNRYLDGMFSSACAGVSALPSDLDAFFLLPADCCAVYPETLTILMERFADSGGTYVTRPKYQGQRGHPPLIPACYVSPLLSYNGENGLKGFLSPLPTLEVEMDKGDSLPDMDTPEDYAHLLSFLGFPCFPDKEQCAELFDKHETPLDIIEHGEHVAAIALGMARDMTARGASLDLALLESACLLHDICRMKSDHAQEGMKLLLHEGYPKTAMLVETHMDLQERGGVEAELLFLADKLCRRGKIVRLEDTLLELETRFADDPIALSAAKRRIQTAKKIMDELKIRHYIKYENYSEPMKMAELVPQSVTKDGGAFAL